MPNSTNRVRSSAANKKRTSRLMRSRRAGARKGIFIVSDIEGVSGSVWGGMSYGLPVSGERHYFTAMMTAEVDAVVRALYRAGERHVVLYEAHAMQPGILPDTLERTRDIEGMKSCRSVFFVGQHGSAYNAKAVLGHTMSSQSIYRMRLNGMLCGELTLVASYAGALGLPVVFVSGDSETGKEAQKNLPPLRFVCDSEGLSNHSAICRPLQDLLPEMEQAVPEALAAISNTPPFDVGPVKLEIEPRYDGMGDKISRYPFVRLRGHTLVMEAPDAITAFRYRKLEAEGRAFWNWCYARP